MIPELVLPGVLRLELKPFRHVFAHACELELDPEKLALLLEYAHSVADLLAALVEDFIREVARE